VPVSAASDPAAEPVSAGSDPAAVEAAADLGSPVEFFGETFHFAPAGTYDWEMMEFASAATGGMDTNSLAAASAMYRLLQAVIRDEEWQHFSAVARRNKARVQQDLMPIAVLAYLQKTERPTGRPSDSSAGPQLVPASSEVDSFAERVIAREEAAGRADRAAMVAMARDAQKGPSAG
jgi:hypothetical protein